VDTPRPSPRTNRTRRIPHPVLIGHAARFLALALTLKLPWVPATPWDLEGPPLAIARARLAMLPIFPARARVRLVRGEGRGVST
jgi:hypothetical protein